MNREEFIETYLQVVHPRPTLTEASMMFNEFQEDIENSDESSLLDIIMGGNPVNNIPSVSYTYTDTPMAEEYYGG